MIEDWLKYDKEKNPKWILADDTNKQVGLFICHSIELSLQERKELEDNFVIPEKQEDPKEKMRKLTDLIFELEQNLQQIADEKIPFEERKKDIEREIAKSKERLDLISERLKNRWN